MPEPLQPPPVDDPDHDPLPVNVLPDLVIEPLQDPPVAPPDAAVKFPVGSTVPVIDPDTAVEPWLVVTVPEYEPDIEPSVIDMLKDPLTVALIVPFWVDTVPLPL